MVTEYLKAMLHNTTCFISSTHVGHLTFHSGPENMQNFKILRSPTIIRIQVAHLYISILMRSSYK